MLKKFFEAVKSPFSTKEIAKFDTNEKKMFELRGSENAELPTLDNNVISYGITFDESFKNIREAIEAYRRVAQNHVVESAIDEIVCSAIVEGTNGKIVSINLDGIDEEIISEKTKEDITDEFKYILSLLNFRNDGARLFRKWYVDGRLWGQKVNNGKEIKKINHLSPLELSRYKGEDGNIYYKYTPQLDSIFALSNDQEAILNIPEKDIFFVPSGKVDCTEKHYISYLQGAIKPLNQLKLVEDYIVIYRIARSPERRVFYIDVGEMGKADANQYVNKLIKGFKRKIVYDPATGDVTENRNTLSMFDDIYIPLRGDQGGTKVETLEGGSQVGKIEDLEYCRKNLISTLKVPTSRLSEDSPTIDLGRSGELTHAELKYGSFIKRLQSDFSWLFVDILKTQLILKNVVNIEEWNKIKNDISFDWESNSYYTELKEFEILNERLELLATAKEYIGKYFSDMWVRKNILKQNEAEIEALDDEIKSEIKDGTIKEPSDDEEPSF